VPGPSSPQEDYSKAAVRDAWVKLCVEQCREKSIDSSGKLDNTAFKKCKLACTKYFDSISNREELESVDGGSTAEKFVEGYSRGLLAIRESGRWWSKLPDCPCEVDLTGDPGDDWCWDFNRDESYGSDQDAAKFHPGAHACMRTLQHDDYHYGQQCCYDAYGKLIKSGAGAGTPDYYATAQQWRGHSYGCIAVDSTIYSHVYWDVNTFEGLGWERYHEYWPPNQGKDCP